MKLRSKVIIILSSAVAMGFAWAFFALREQVNFATPLNILILVLIIIFGAVAFRRALKKEREEKAGIPPEDEMSTLIKYKSGYYAYMASMYMWLFIFLLKGKFPDTETMLGGGILLSALIFYISGIIVKRRLNE